MSFLDPNDVHAWSGLVFHIARALSTQGLSLFKIGPLRQQLALLYKAKQLVYRLRGGQRHFREWEPVISEGYARQVARMLNGADIDVVFSPSTIPLARLRGSQPAAFWVDATFPAMLDYYPEFSNVSRASIRNAIDGEKRALDRCTIAIYSSDWAAQSAINDLGADPAKVHVVPFGANLEVVPSEAEVKQLIAKRQLKECQMLFLGVDWHRKGGPFAVQVVTRLNERGLRTELVVAGCEPTDDLPDFVRRVGFVSKASAAGAMEVSKLLADAHFLILPTRADASPVVIAEASSHGVPSLAPRIGGIPTVLRDGINGQTFPLGASPDDYAEFVLQTLRDPNRYSSLAASAYHEYATRLNWDTAGGRVANLLRRAASGSPPYTSTTESM